MHRIEKDWSNRLDVLMRGRGGERVLWQRRIGNCGKASSVRPRCSPKSRFFMNEEFTLVDCCVAPVLWRLKFVEVDLPERQTRPMTQYMQKIFARQSFRDSLTELEVEMGE